MTNLNTIDDVLNRLCDGLTYSEQDYDTLRHWLLEYQAANQLTLKELDDFCFSDSDWIFNHAFACYDRDYDEDEDKGYSSEDDFNTICLCNDDYELDMRTGEIRIDKQVFDDFVPNSIIKICFSDEDYITNEYQMKSEDDEWIYCDYFGDCA